MNKLIGLICVMTLSFGAILGAEATVINIKFEDFTTVDDFLPTNYGGITWDSNWHYWNASSSPYYLPSSGDYVIYTHNYGGWIDFGEEVTFLGSWVDLNTSGQTAYWEGYRDGKKIIDSKALTNYENDWINVHWEGVDQVKFVSSSFNHFIIDDIKYKLNDKSAVPEPATIFLLGSGLIGLAGFRKKLKK